MVNNLVLQMSHEVLHNCGLMQNLSYMLLCNCKQASLADHYLWIYFQWVSSFFLSRVTTNINLINNLYLFVYVCACACTKKNKTFLHERFLLFLCFSTLYIFISWKLVYPPWLRVCRHYFTPDVNNSPILMTPAVNKLQLSPKQYVYIQRFIFQI